MYRLLGIAKYDDRYVIPTASPESARGITSLDPFGDTDPSQAFADLGMGAPSACHEEAAPSGKVSLLSWDGDRPDAMFPDRIGAPDGTQAPGDSIRRDEM